MRCAASWGILVALTIFAVGCAAPTGILARPVVIGASVSSGDSSMMGARGAGGRANPELAPVGLAKAMDACLSIRHGETKNLAEGSMALHPEASLTRQVSIAGALHPTVVVALDALFWAAYGPAASSEERMQRLRSCCAVLARCDAPMIVGTLPDMRGSVAAMLGDGAAPSEVDRAALNRELEAWAASRPNVLLLSLERLVEDIRRGGTVDLGLASLDPRETSRVFAADGLHLTSDGEIALATLTLSAMVSAKTLPPDAVYRDLRLSRAVLARQREIAASRPKSELSMAQDSLDRQRASLARTALIDGAVAGGDLPRAADLVAERFAPVDADIRTLADVLETQLTLERTPALLPLVQSRLGAMTSGGVAPSGRTTEEVVSLIECSFALGQPGDVGPLLAELRARADRDRAGHSIARPPSAAGYAYRVYDWFVDRHPEVVILLSDVRSATRELADRQRASLETMKSARSAGFKLGSAHVRTPREELERYAKALRAVGRTAEADQASAIAATAE